MSLKIKKIWMTFWKRSTGSSGEQMPKQYSRGDFNDIAGMIWMTSWNRLKQSQRRRFWQFSVEDPNDLLESVLQDLQEKVCRIFKRWSSESWSVEVARSSREDLGSFREDLPYFPEKIYRIFQIRPAGSFRDNSGDTINDVLEKIYRILKSSSSWESC